MSSDRKVPEGRFSRFARLAAVGVRTGAGLLLDRDGTSTAKQAAEVLGTLRGLAAKIGQMASYVDGVVPEEHREAYEAAMSKLRAQAPTSSSAAIRAVIEEELAQPLTALFADWEDEPIASASIGQVHRAVLRDGSEVAVKVQHPGIARAVESDLANASILESMAGVLGAKKFETKAMLDVIRKRFREELDYSLEAQRLVWFANIHGSDPRIRVPRLIASHSSRRVLTTEFVRGLPFEDACRATENERRAWAETLWRFVFKGNLIGGQFNADPHPGNYIFLPHGKVAFIDYGCVQIIDEHRRASALYIHRAALVRDEASFARGVLEMIQAKPGRLADMAVDYTRRCFEPLFQAPYRITQSYAASLVDGMKDMAIVARKIDEREFFPMPPEMVFINRLQFGFYSVLARLDVDVDYSAVEASFLNAESNAA
jgi:predicted unusual protein kinase regulating ubiquinone biosynthesis (AarF/ABC1/UbiB family)